MPKCAVKKCKNYTLKVQKKDGVSYFHFPRNEIQREEWSCIIQRDRDDKSYKPNNSSVICSDHFSKHDIYITSKGYKRIIKTAIPVIQPEESTTEKVDERKSGSVIAHEEIIYLDSPCKSSTLNTEFTKDTETLNMKVEKSTTEKSGRVIAHEEIIYLDSSCTRSTVNTEFTKVTETLNNMKVENSIIEKSGNIILYLDPPCTSSTVNTEFTKVTETLNNIKVENSTIEKSLDSPCKSSTLNKEFSKVTETLNNMKVEKSLTQLESTHIQHSIDLSLPVIASSNTTLSTGKAVDSRRITSLEEELKICKQKLINKNKKVKNLQKINRRLKKRKATLKNKIIVLKKIDKDLDKSVLDKLSSHVEVTDTFKALFCKNIRNKKKPFVTYPPGARKFAQKLHRLSPAAYRYVRKVFHNCLPHPNTLFGWIKGVNANPGCTEPLDRLNNEQNQSVQSVQVATNNVT